MEEVKGVDETKQAKRFGSTRRKEMLQNASAKI